jgi:hypothetical protein
MWISLLGLILWLVLGRIRGMYVYTHANLPAAGGPFLIYPIGSTNNIFTHRSRPFFILNPFNQSISKTNRATGLLKDVGPLEDQVKLAEEARDKAEAEVKAKTQVCYCCG